MHLTQDPTAAHTVTPTAAPTSLSASVDRLTSATFDEVIVASDRPILVDFTAAWCPPCRQLSPVLHSLAIEQVERLRVVEVDIDQSPDLALRHQVLSAPTMVLYVGGQVALTMVGSRGRARLLEDLAPHLD